MTDNEQKLDEILEDFGVSCARKEVVTQEDANGAKQAILKWRDKAVIEAIRAERKARKLGKKRAKETAAHIASIPLPTPQLSQWQRSALCEGGNEAERC